MKLSIDREVGLMQSLSMPELRARYAELFHEPTHANNRLWLIKRIAWRLQALAEGDLSERARRRAEELANDADLRTSAPRPRQARTITAITAAVAVPTRSSRDERLPMPGTVLTRSYKGRLLQVKVLAQGFQLADTVYPSLSAVAKAITGAHCNGYLFFRLGQQGGER
jgi:hypothetical protein